MVAKVYERLFFLVYGLGILGTVGILFLQEPPAVPRYWGLIFLVGALAPLAALGWLRRQLEHFPFTTMAFGTFALWVWSFDTQRGRFDSALFVLPIIVAVAWVIRGLTKKETSNGL